MKQRSCIMDHRSNLNSNRCITLHKSDEYKRAEKNTPNLRVITKNTKTLYLRDDDINPSQLGAMWAFSLRSNLR